jgi:hypothetical protein
MAKLSREQIKKGLETIPMESILQGATGTIPNLTKKQIEFAKEVALSKATQADAYRKVYKSKGRPKTVGSNASRLATDERIATAIEAFRTAEAYREYQTPAQLRSLVVSQLTQHVLDPDFPPAQRVQCLKLLGSVAEIGLFVDRKETLVVHQSSEIKQRLLDQLKNVINADVQDVTVNDDADSLLEELKSADANPTVPAPPELVEEYLGEDIHTIPHEPPSPESIPDERFAKAEKDLRESGEIVSIKDALGNTSS